MSGNKKNVMIFMIIILVTILLIFRVTYAIFALNLPGSTNQKLIVGDIYMKYTGKNQLTLDNMIPSSSYNENNYFEFTVSGKNTSAEKNIYYEVILSRGENHETRTTRIRDDLLKFTLIEIKNNVETIVANGVSFNQLNNTRLWVNTIDKNTETIEISYKLYAWISDDIEVGNTATADYDINTWNNDVYATINVGVSGDLTEKSN